MADLLKIERRRIRRREENERYVREHVGQNRGYSSKKRHSKEPPGDFRDRRRAANRRRREREND